jgi:hypothetical protein
MESEDNRAYSLKRNDHQCLQVLDGESLGAVQDNLLSALLGNLYFRFFIRQRWILREAHTYSNNSVKDARNLRTFIWGIHALPKSACMKQWDPRVDIDEVKVDQFRHDICCQITVDVDLIIDEGR